MKVSISVIYIFILVALGCNNELYLTDNPLLKDPIVKNYIKKKYESKEYTKFFITSTRQCVSCMDISYIKEQGYKVIVLGYSEERVIRSNRIHRTNNTFIYFSTDDYIKLKTKYPNRIRNIKEYLYLIK